MTLIRRVILAVPALIGAGFAFGSNALADKPHPWQIGFQEPATSLMKQIDGFHDFLFWFAVLPISLFVLALLIYTMIKFNERANPTPSKTTHNTTLEVIWTVVPVIMLVIIAIPSFRVLYAQETVPKADITIKAIGHQWYWSYEYPDHGGFTFDSVMIPENEIKPGQTRLLDVDNQVVIPVNATVRVITTSTDVIHAWTIPSFGVKKDSVPGRTTEMWFKVEREGTYYGQCSELCGVNHGFMPIAVRVVSKAAFDKWVADAKKKFASNDAAPETKPVRLAETLVGKGGAAE